MYACNQCDAGCRGSTNCKCYACGLPVCVSCSRLLRDSCSKGRRRRICLNCAVDWPTRYGFNDWRKKNMRRDAYENRPQRVEPYYFWAATEPDCLKSPAEVMAVPRDSAVMAVLAENSDIESEAWDPPEEKIK